MSRRRAKHRAFQFFYDLEDGACMLPTVCAKRVDA